MPHGGPHLPGGEPLTTDDEGNVTGSPEEEFQVVSDEAQGPSPIGVPSTVRGPDGEPVPFQAIREGRVAAPFDPRLQGRTDLLPGGAATVPGQVRVSPQYYDGHEKQPALFQINSVEDRLRTQLALEEAGLLDEYSPGEWDEPTWKAFRNVLEHANVNGLDWKTSLNQLVTNPRVDKDGDGDGGAEYLAPDYATLAQNAKQAIRQNLGREPKDWEVKLLADEMGGGYQEQLTQQQQMDRYERDVALGEAEPGETFREVDPKARFAERFEELYGPEIEAEQREEDAQTNTQLLMRSITGMDRTVGS